MEVIQWLQSFASPTADAFWGTVTDLMSEDVFLLVIPLFFWCVDAWKGWLFGNLMLLSIIGNEALKAVINMPRPTTDEVRVIRDDTVSGSSFPSGHAQFSVTFWGYLAWLAKQPLMWGLALVMALLIGVSRMYLGLHWPVDVLAGYIAGIVGLSLAILAYNRWHHLTLNDWHLALRVLFTIAPALAFLLLPSKTVAVAAGMFLGFNLGFLWILPRHMGTYSARASLTTQLLKAVIGFAGMMLLRSAIKAVLPETLPADFVRYAIIGLWAGWLAPYIFARALRPAPRVAPEQS